MKHRLISQLANAQGASEFVIAANVDIRGFTSFAASVDSVDVAVYLCRVYLAMLDGYFGAASFFKLTGDGLLLVFPFGSEEELKAQAVGLIEESFRLLDDFASLAKQDPLVYFDTPSAIGIGISRGAAYRRKPSCRVHDRRRARTRGDPERRTKFDRRTPR